MVAGRDILLGSAGNFDNDVRANNNITLTAGRTIRLDVPARWLKRHPLTLHLLVKEREEWKALGFRWRQA